MASIFMLRLLQTCAWRPAYVSRMPVWGPQHHVNKIFTVSQASRIRLTPRGQQTPVVSRLDMNGMCLRHDAVLGFQPM